MDSKYALGRIDKKGASVKTGVCVHILAEPVTDQPYGTQPHANRSGIADSKHGVLGAPMHMQSKETHKCNQNKKSWVWVKFSKSPAESSETVDVPKRPGRESRFVHLGLTTVQDSMSQSYI